MEGLAPEQAIRIDRIREDRITIDFRNICRTFQISNDASAACQGLWALFATTVPYLWHLAHFH